MQTVYEEADTGESDARVSSADIATSLGRPARSVEAVRSFPPQQPPDVSGLVLCTTTGRKSVSEPSVADLLGLGGLVVSGEQLHDAAGSFRPSGHDWSSGAESPNPRVVVTPGMVRLTGTSWLQESRQAELAAENRIRAVDAAGRVLADNPDWKPKGAPSRQVTDWSARSRSNMYRTLASLDWSPLYALGRAVAMVTLTYPDDWRTVCPGGRTAKAQLKAFRKRYERAWGEQLVAAWKLEFQRRGAPHYHLLMAPPTGRSAGDLRSTPGLPFRDWLSIAWARIVNHPDPAEYRKHLAAGTQVKFGEGLKCSDPKRLAVYFGKHGAYREKEYQNTVPDDWGSVGRFWGFWGLKPLAATADMAPDDYQLAKRIMRRYSARVQTRDGWQKSVGQVDVWRRRIDYQTGEVVYRRRRATRPVRRFTGKGGFLIVNNGPQVAAELARALQVCGAERTFHARD